MRKRSGALHSQTEQDFLLLAELSHEKTGYFYDETLHAQLTKEMACKKKIQRQPEGRYTPNHFEGFDFSMDDREKQEELQELQAENKAVLVNFVLVCNNQTELKQILMELWPCALALQGDSPQRRGIDLHIVNFKDTGKGSHCLKFWIIETQLVDNIMYASYFKRAVRVLNFSQSGGIGEQHRLKEAKATLLEVAAFAN